MDGISSSLAAASTALAAAETGNAVQTKVLGEALDQAAQTLLPLLEGLGENVDVTA